MAFQVSPGVNVSEIDLTTIVPAAATTDGAMVGEFAWGPVKQITLIENELELLNIFQKPNDDTAVSFFTAANFLAYGNNLRVVRVVGSGALNATAEATTGSQTPGTGLLIENDDVYDSQYADGSGNVGPFAARHPGALGNSLKVSICPSANAYSQELTGVSSTGTTLSGTGFTSTLEAGSLITSASGETRQIVSVTNATTAVLNAAFTVDLSSETVTAEWEFVDQIQFTPGTSDYASSRGGSDDELHVIVIDEDGLITGVAGTVLERMVLASKASDAKTSDGASSYYKEVINRTSKWVRWMDHLPAGTNWGSPAQGITFTAVNKPETYSLAGGAAGSAASDAAKNLGYDLFADPETVEVSLIMGADASATVAIHIINNICETRKDCIALLSPPMDTVVNNPDSEVDDIVTFRDQLPSTSYAVLDSGWKYQYDKYNDTYRWVPMNGDIAGLCVRTDEDRDPWFSPAGFNRGNIKNVIKLAFNPNKSERDDLYRKGVNPVVSFPGQGTVLYGDKTLLAKPSAFDRINVRRLFIVLEKSISKAARFSLFEFNDEFTRAQFKSLVEPFLRDVQGRRGIFAYRVVCDETNNTAEVIDRNEFVGDIYIKPARSINFIQLNFVAVRSGVQFEEVVGRF